MITPDTRQYRRAMKRRGRPNQIWSQDHRPARPAGFALASPSSQLGRAQRAYLMQLNGRGLSPQMRRGYIAGDLAIGKEPGRRGLRPTMILDEI